MKLHSFSNTLEKLEFVGSRGKIAQILIVLMTFEAGAGMTPFAVSSVFRIRTVNSENSVSERSADPMNASYFRKRSFLRRF